MAFPDDDLAPAVGSALGSEVAHVRRLGGGDVAESFRMDLSDGFTVFAKTHRNPPPGFFTTEATGLGWLRETGTANVPEVLAVLDGTDEEPPMLVLEWIDVGGRAGYTEAGLGRELAALHSTPWSCFGRPDGRTTGSRGLPNDVHGTWAESYRSNRLLPLARLSRDSGVLTESVVADLEGVAGRLEELAGEAEPPSLLHGDLWAGNRLVDADGRSWLIDPAAHGGHREFDLAMMRLFGGFGADCFDAYEEAFPLADGWRERVELHQLAPLVGHAIKFGGSYVPAATTAVRRYC